MILFGKNSAAFELSLHFSLSLFIPLLQQFHDRFLHLTRGEALWEILVGLIVREGNSLDFLFLFGNDRIHDVRIEFPVLNVSLAAVPAIGTALPLAPP